MPTGSKRFSLGSGGTLLSTFSKPKRAKWKSRLMRALARPSNIFSCSLRRDRQDEAVHSGAAHAGYRDGSDRARCEPDHVHLGEDLRDGPRLAAGPGYGGGNPGQHRSAGGLSWSARSHHRQSNPLLAVDGIESGYGRVKVLHGITLKLLPGEPSTHSTTKYSSC